MTDSADDTADAFAALSDPLRVEVLRTLGDHHADGASAVGFADLRKAVGVRDSGRFRYHLNELRDRFVEKADGGYRLTHAGTQVVGAIHAGTYTGTVSLGPTELDSECPFCGGPAVATCEDGRVRVTCPEDHPLFVWSVPPNGVGGATITEAVDLAELLAVQAIERALAGTCPQCYGEVAPELLVDDVPRPTFRTRCDTCGGRVVGPATFCLLVDPAVTDFCRRHGWTLRDDHVWELPFVPGGDAVEVGGEDPVRVAVAFAVDGDRLTVILDGRGHVREVERGGS